MIIAFYKRLDYLDLIFQSFELQSLKDFEIVIAEDDPYSEANARGVLSCSEQLKLDSAMLVQLVETNYAQNPDSWALAPSQVLRTGLFAMCKTYINNFRRAKGLDLLK